MSVLLQISDTHFGTEQPPVVEALLRLANHQRPEVVVWSGDITQRARRAQFAAAGRFAGRLGDAPCVVIPGNHDIALFDVASRLLRPYANHVAVFGEPLEPVLSMAGWLVIGVNTTRWWRHKNGEVSQAQIERVASRLGRASRDQLRIVVVHQPVWVPVPSEECNLLRGHQAAVQRWAEAGADIVMGGHIHLPYVKELAVTAGGRTRSLWAVQAGTAVSSRVRVDTPNSVNLVRATSAATGVGTGRYAVERWDFSATQGEFLQVAQVDLVPFRG